MTSSRNSPYEQLFGSTLVGLIDRVPFSTNTEDLLEGLKAAHENLQAELQGLKEDVGQLREEVQEVRGELREGMQTVHTKLDEHQKQMENLTNKVENLNPSKAHKPIQFNFEGPVVSFVGRKQQLAEIKDQLQGKRTSLVISAVSGMGGIGKTQLAKMYAQENLDYYGGNILWIECENQLRFTNSFHDLAKEVGVPTIYKQEEGIRNITSIIKDVLYHFKEGCLFVLDNVGEGLEIDSFLETNSPNIHILITSRNKNWDQEKVQVLKLETFSVEEAERFVTDILNNEDIEDIRRLVVKLDKLPLALAAAVYFIRQEKELLEMVPSKTYRIFDYLNHYERNSEEVLQLQSIKLEKSVFLALEMSYEKIASGKEEFHKTALKLLKMFSYFSPDAIKIEWFEDGFQQRTFLEGVQLLSQYSLIQTDKGLINIHRLTQEVTRIKVNNNNEEEEILVDCVKIVEKLPKYQETNYTQSVLNYACKYTSIINKFRESNFDILSNALENSCQFGSLDDIKFLISKGAKINYAGKLDVNLLHLAAFGAKIDIIDYLIQKGLEVESLDVDGSTPLQFACVYGNLDTVQFLISKGAKIYSTNKNYQNVLHLASAGGKIEIIEYLLQAGLEIESLDINRTTPLQLACKFGNLGIVKFLIYKNANIRSINKYDQNLLHLAAIRGKVEIIEYLIEKGLEIETSDINRSTPLQLACEFGTLNAVKFLISKGAKINSTNKYHQNVLHLASFGGKVEIIEYLIEKGVEIKSLDVFGKTPLQLACSYGHLECVQVLISKGAKIHSTNKFDQNLLHLAAIAGKVKIIEYLIEKGVEIESLDVDGNTPLQLACRDGSLETIKFLISKKANIKCTNKFGKNLLDEATKNYNTEIVDYLKDIFKAEQNVKTF